MSSSSPSTSTSTSKQTSDPTPRWFYARSDDWTTFPSEDDRALEERWQSLGGASWARQAAREVEEENSRKKREEEEEDQQEKSLKERREEKEKEQVRREASGWIETSSLSSSSSSSSSTAEGLALHGNKAQDTASTWGSRLLSRIWSSSDRPEGESGQTGDEEEKKESSRNTPASSKPKTDDEKATIVEEILDPDEPSSARTHKVEVLEDHLFDVDLRKMQMYPAFFKGVLLPVIRSTWFYWSEMKDEYSPIRWDSDLAKDLDTAWKESGAADLGQQREGKGDDADHDGSPTSDVQKLPKEKETKLIDIRSEEVEGKGKVKFISPVEGKIFSEDFRGRLVSLVGGATVIRGFEEVERRTKAAKQNHFFSMPDLPWKLDQDEGDLLNKAVTASGRAGAAQPDSDKAPAGGGGYGSTTKSAAGKKHRDQGEETEENQGFASSLWPSSESWLRPKFNIMKSLGLSDSEATEEAKRDQKQKSTEEGTKPESEVRDGHTKSSSAGSRSQQDSELVDGDEEGSGRDLEGALPDKGDPNDESRKDDPVHLILTIHGIGQGLRDTFESLDFTYDVQKIRNLSRERAQDPALRILSKGRRVQYLPVCWRRDLDLKYHTDENDNHFELNDVTNGATIPFVRNVVSKVILDIPYYLSAIHKPKMVAAVLQELNRVYRLFIRRNPDFLKKGGKVSFISHSLGSCLTADILSSQPTTVPSIETLSKEEIKDLSTKRLLFNVHDVFLVGSPLGLFLLLGGGQLIARKVPRNAQLGEDASLDLPSGRRRVGEKDGKEDEEEEEGQVRYGCMAIHGNLFNCYNASDPVAYRLNAAVDQRYARLLNPMPLPGAVNAILDALKQPRMSISKLFDPRDPFGSSRCKAEAIKERTSSSSSSSSSSGSIDDDKEGFNDAELRRYAETIDDLPGLDAKSNKRSKAAASAIGRAVSGEEDGEEGVEDDEDVELGKGGPGGLASPVRVEEGTRAKEALPMKVLSKEREKKREEMKLTKQKKKNKEDNDDDDGGEREEEDSSSTTEQVESARLACSRSLDLASLNKAERRFRALNKHGCIDYYFSTASSSMSASLGEYIAMISAHNGYWTSPAFVSLILSQVWVDEDVGRSSRVDEKEVGEGKKERRGGSGLRDVTLVPNVGE